LTVTVDGGEAVRATRLVLPDTAAEYRFRPADEARLAAIAQATGGVVSPDADAIRRSTVRQAARRALWPFLVLAALVFWLADVFFRRVRVFEGAGQTTA